MLIEEYEMDVDFNGLVIFSYPHLLNFFGGAINSGDNILKKFTDTPLGDTVLDLGVAIPILGIDDGGYLVRVFCEEMPAYGKNEKLVFSDSGYVLDANDPVYLADLAVFWDWEEFLAWKKILIPAGYYSLTLNGFKHFDTDGKIKFDGFDLVLKKCTTLPERTAKIRPQNNL